MEEVEKILKEKAKLKPVSEYSLTYDSPSQQLEPIYYWILDFVSDLGFDTEKLIDSFTASPGGGYFSEIGRRATIMQEQAMKYLGAINQVIKSIINLIWDLKEFEIRLKLYDALKSKDEKTRTAALNALKEIWITNVDIKKGRGAINVLATQLEFVTLRDAFFIVKDEKDVDKLDLNERVKNILRSRIIEFNQWLELSEKELRNRYNIEKTYLKSQVASLKLYARWARPYIKAAEELMMKETKSSALVSAFSTMLLELLLMGKKKFSIEALPKELKSYFGKKKIRNFYGLIFIDFNFRGIPRVISETPHYTFGGRVDISFKAYVVNEDQLEEFKKEFEKQEFEEIIKIATDVTEESLKVLAEDLKHFLEEKEKEEKPEKLKGLKGGIITDIFNLFRKKEKPGKTKEKEKRMGEENYYEKFLRKIVEEEMKKICFKVYDTYKKAHGMPSYPSPYE
jgi:hypothetical protein